MKKTFILAAIIGFGGISAPAMAGGGNTGIQATLVSAAGGGHWERRANTCPAIYPNNCQPYVMVWVPHDTGPTIRSHTHRRGHMHMHRNGKIHTHKLRRGHRHGHRHTRRGEHGHDKKHIVLDYKPVFQPIYTLPTPAYDPTYVTHTSYGPYVYPPAPMVTPVVDRPPVVTGGITIGWGGHRMRHTHEHKPHRHKPHKPYRVYHANHR